MSTLAVVIPYFNEADFIGETLRGCLQQSRRPDRLILVDNASTDGSLKVCRQVLGREPGIPTTFLTEPKPGKIHALEAASRYLTTDYTAFWDADTHYPPHYLQVAEQILDSADEIAAVMGKDIGPEHSWASQFQLGKAILLSKLLPWQAFTGGFGHTFRTSAYLAAGGFSVAWWDFVLEDHEIMWRIHEHGRSVYDRRMWCQPSTRRGHDIRKGWTLWERLVYHATPRSRQKWFFRSFLGPRLARRRSGQDRLREHPWEQAA